MHITFEIKNHDLADQKKGISYEVLAALVKPHAWTGSIEADRGDNLVAALWAGHHPQDGLQGSGSRSA
jgi:hypothetical protein